MNKMKNCIVVGGGICGIFSSILLASKFEKVYVVDTDIKCGGLLRSIQDDKGIFYDQGPHIPNTTLIPEIDDVIFGLEHERKNEWNELHILKTGNYSNGVWNLDTQLVDSRNLPLELYKKGVFEILTRTESSNSSDISNYLKQTIGPTFSEELIFPILRKLYGDDINLESLESNIPTNYFGLKRILCLNPEITNKLKELKAFDEKLGFHLVENFSNQMKNICNEQEKYYYPKDKKGIQYLIDMLVAEAKEKGVIFLMQENIQKIIHKNNIIESVILGKSKNQLDCDFLFWTAPPIFALKAAGLEVKKANINLRTSNIFHFNFKQPILNNESHYLWNWDPSFKSFRITLFPNLKIHDNNTDIFNLSVEVLSNRDDADLITSSHIVNELKEINLIADDATIASHARQIIHNTFPVPTFEFSSSSKKNYKYLAEAFKNICISGRFGGKDWTQNDVLKGAHNEIKKRFF